MSKLTKDQIVAVVKPCEAVGTTKTTQRPALKKVTAPVTPLASKFAIKLSTMLRSVSRQKRDRMIELLTDTLDKLPTDLSTDLPTDL